MENSQSSSQLSTLKRAFLTIEEMEARIRALQRQKIEPIAIVGMACRFPGGADLPEAYWQILYEGVDAIIEVPTERWSIDEHYSSDPNVPGKMNTRSGGFLKEPVDTFDPQFFGISPREANSMDPQQRLLLEVSWEALENAGQAPSQLDGTRTGVFIGATSFDYANLFVKRNDPKLLDGYFASGIAHSIISGRLSYVLGLHGPSITIDTACSSSLTAIHLACQSLRSGETSMALAGGVNLILTPDNYIAFSKYGMLAPDGRCKTFDDSADGFSRGEGCGVIVLKRLSDAQAHGDRILALIRGTAASQDGASSGLTVPNGPSQETVIREALENSGQDPSKVGYVEAHGTGTSLGDPIEVRALGNVFTESHSPANPLIIGSVKTNIGHLEAASGVAGLIKVVLSLQHGIIPPSLHFKTPSHLIAWEDLPFLVPTLPAQWPEHNGTKSLGGVSSFGFSGTNVHIVVEATPEAANKLDQEEKVESTSRPLHLLTLSARTDNALKALAERFHAYFRNTTDDLGDICFTANAGRSHFNQRLAITAKTPAQMGEKLTAFIADQHERGVVQGAYPGGDPPKVGFLFTGQGSQYARMALGLYQSEPVFRAVLDRCANYLTPYLDRPLLSVIFTENEEDQGLIDHTSYTQPAMFSIQMALVELWKRWGILPGAVLGHSVGAYAAACTAGIFSLEDGLKLITTRGKLMGGLPAGGSMAAVFADEATIWPFLAPYLQTLSIATLNTPDNTVISGDDADVQTLISVLQAQNIQSRLLKVSHAFHSKRMDPILDQLENDAAMVKFSAPRIPFISDTTGELALGNAATNAAYWRKHTRGAVRYADGLETMYQEGISVFLEIGPAATLIAMGQRCLSGKEKQPVWLASLKARAEDCQQILSTLSSLYVNGVPVDWEKFENSQNRLPLRRISLPTYPFQRTRHWLTHKDAAPTLFDAKVQNDQIHPLLGQRVRSAVKGAIFETKLRCKDFSFLNDHRILGAPVLPAAAFMETALFAAKELYHTLDVAVRDLTLFDALCIREDETRIMQFVATPAAEDTYHFEFYSQGEHESEWKMHASGELIMHGQTAPQSFDLEKISRSCLEEITSEDHVRQLRERGMEFGPSLMGVRNIRRRNGEALGQIDPTTSVSEEGGNYLLHPALLDAHLQTLAGALEKDAGTYLPFNLASYRVYRQDETPVWSYVLLKQHAPSSETVTGSVFLLGEKGDVVAAVQDINLKLTSSSDLLRLSQSRLEDWLYEMEWQPAPLQPGNSSDDSKPILRRPGNLASQPPASAVTFGNLPEIQEYGLQILPVLEQCTTAFIVHAFLDLGWHPQCGQRFTTTDFANQLKIAPRHLELFERLLVILSEEKILCERVEDWEVIHLPELNSPEPRLAALLDAHPASQAEVRFTQRCGSGLALALKGETDPLQLLFPGGDLSDAENLYENSLTARAYNSLLSDLVQSALATLPADRRLRILEVGAGTGGTTAFVLPKIPSERTDYLYTDVSPLFLSRAREKFAAYPFMRFELVDVEKDLGQQGLAGETFDLIIAANIIHATTDLKASLTNLRRALSPGGLMFLLEVTAPQRWIDISFGLTEGWWHFTDRDLRKTYPLLNQSDWLDLFKANGFDDVAAFPSAKCPVEQVVLVAQNQQTRSQPGSWIVFADEGTTGTNLAEQLHANGDRCLLVKVGASDETNGDDWKINPAQPDEYRELLKAASPCRGIVHLWSLDLPELDEISNEEELERAQMLGCGSVLHLLRAIADQEKADPAPLWLVTRGAQAVQTEITNPAQSSLWGFARSITLELPELSCKILDLSKEANAADTLWAEIHQSDQENQIVWREGIRYAARLKRSRSALAASTIPAEPVRLEITQRGSLDNISFQPIARRQPTQGEVEIQVQTVGLNFKDVLNTLGMYPGDPGPLGGECAGLVSAVGSGVDHLHVGDPVIALASGAFASYVTTVADLVLPKPSALSMEESASIPIPFITAWFCLYHLAHLSSGQRVLIHAAAGGVGMAAVQLAQRAGAEIFATAGNPEKRAYLRSLGVQHVFDLRSLDFAAEILQLTAGRGVDVVLNSLAGEFVAKSLSVLAANGCFLEIGKTGILSDEEAAQAGFNNGRTYHVIDWGETARQDPSLIRSIFSEILNTFAEGKLHLLPRRVFNADEIIPAFRFMAQAGHTGKIVIRMPNARHKLKFLPDASYLVTGGLGGLGLLTAEWIAQQGAGSLVLVGRSAPSEQALNRIHQIEKNGTRMTILQGDISKEVDVRRILAHIETHLHPLRGIIHSAGILADGILIQQNWEQFSDVLAPKVIGSWNLHRFTRHLPLDFFVMYSSIASIFGAPGQANHSAANAFMDALAHYRRNQGLAASSINWGVWSHVGVAAEQHVEDRASLQKIGTISPGDGLTLFEKLLSANSVQIAVSPIYWPTFLRTFAGGRKPPFLKNMVQERESVETSHLIMASEGKKSSLMEQLRQASPARRQVTLLNYVRQQVARILSLEDEQMVLDQKPLNEMGLDSLMAVELRNLLGEGLKLKQPLPATLVFNYPTVAAISKYLAHDILALDLKAVVAEEEPMLRTAGSKKIESNTLNNVLDGLDVLSDDEIDRILTQKMNRKTE